MGKKKVLKQTESDLMQETKSIEDAVAKSSGSVVRKNAIVRKGQAFIDATYNNTRITITDENGNVLAWSSAGSLGFKGAKKSTPYAAAKVAETVIEKIKKTGLQDLIVYVKGIGQGRESAARGLANFGLNIVSIADITPVPHNGCKAKKPRRI
ncbi:30S ribosomal protein S11 [Candidatus Azambacteria bacterium]|nr:30S ribosomal protein S11 [Candidatus Azambacteria bacterium]